jgi:hypothetical protein
MSARIEISTGLSTPAPPTAYTFPYTASGTVNVGDVVYLSGSLQISQSAAGNAATVPPLGVVSAVSGSNYSVAGIGQVAEGLSGLSPNTLYWLDTTPGQITAIQPGSNAYVVGRALSATQLLVLAEADLGSGGGGGPGSTGPTGATGAQGPTGAAGTIGVDGATGPTGAEGPQGSAGADGATGATGPQGYPGVPGLDGNSITWTGTWNPVTYYTLNSSGFPQLVVAWQGSSYIAIQAGANQQPDQSPTYWQLVAEMGATGATGPQGADGATGPTGAVGPTGAGADGATGPTGPQGNPGQSASYYNYEANLSVTSGNPGFGAIAWDNATQTSATTLFINHLTQLNDDVDVFLGMLNQGDTLIIQAQSNSDNFQIFQVTGNVTVNPNSYVEVPVAWSSGSYSFTNNEPLLVILQMVGPTGPQGPQGATGPTGADSTVEGPTGPTGATGPEGAASTVTGPTGSQGATGPTGPAGGGGGTGAVSVVEYNITTTTASSSTSLPSGSVIIAAQIQIVSAYTNGTSISIGYTGSTSSLMATTDNVPATTGIYSNWVMGTSLPSALPVLTTISGSPVAGSATVRVLYTTSPNA